MLINMTLENASIIMVYKKLEEAKQLKHVDKNALHHYNLIKAYSHLTSL